MSGGATLQDVAESQLPKLTDDGTPLYKHRSASDKANILSTFVFAWVGTLINRGRSKKLCEDDLELSEKESAEVCYKTFEVEWNKELAKEKGKPSLVKALARAFWHRFITAAIWKLIWGALILLAAFYFVREIVNFVDQRATRPAWHGWVLATFFFVACVLLSIALQQMSSHCSRAGIRVRAALLTAVYNKAIRSENIGSHVGDVISLVTGDCTRLLEGSTYIHYLWSGPLEALAIVGLLIYLTGYSALVGLGLLLIILPLQYFIGTKITQIRAKNIDVTGGRVSLMSEVLLAIKLVKFYAWERSFADQVSKIRKKELHLMEKNAIIKSVNLMIVFATPPIMALGIFSLYVFTVRPLSASLAFTVLSLFNTLRFPLVVLPRALRGYAESLSALKRIRQFLLHVEVQPVERGDVPEVIMKKASFGYGEEKILKNVTMKLPSSKLLGLVGPVGSGKTTFVSAILGEARLMSGKLDVGGRIAYVTQNPWVQQASVRDNILFGRPYDKKKYDATVHACALEADMATLVNGDLTEIGEGGINISGGQKQRIALARAVYSDSDLYILDSPLSAVDQHTSSHIFDYCIKGLLKKKTVILVTHQFYLLSQCDYVGIMKKGKMTYYGKYDATVIKQQFPAWEDTMEETEEKSKSVQKKKKKSESEATGIDIKSIKQKVKDRSPYSIWIKESGVIVFTISIIIFAVAQGVRIASDYWIKFWVANRFPNLLPKYYVIIYAAFNVAFIIFLLLRGFVFFYVVLKAATRLHNRMFYKVLRAPIAFFTVTPLGPLLNSFSKDQDSVDESLPDAVHMTTIYVMILLTTVIIVCVVAWYYVFVVMALFGSFIFIQWYSTTGVQFIKGLFGLTNAPIFTHVSETLTGISVIRAFGVEQRFMQISLRYVDRNHRALYNLDHVNLWISFYLDIMGALMVFATALFAVGITSLKAADAGLAVSNSIQMLVFFTLIVRGYSDIQSEVKAVERIYGYISKTKTEKTDKQIDLDPSWPSKGKIAYKNSKMSYFENSPPVLKNVSFTFKAGEKIGVVGRTGSGKSSMIMALFRLVELSEGKIEIDGVDISKCGLEEFRSRISIIPQEPVMFKGTIRSNMDPFSEYTDEQLWNALELAHLKQSVLDSPLQLETPVSENGSNYSLGQKQLFCLARTILKNSRILVLDEATSAMDLETDALIQKTIRSVFKDRTMITIAHRLDTIIDSDRILVMDHGNVLEFDSVRNLLKNPKGSFTALVREAKIKVDIFLRDPEEEEKKKKKKKKKGKKKLVESDSDSSPEFEEIEIPGP